MHRIELIEGFDIRESGILKKRNLEENAAGVDIIRRAEEKAEQITHNAEERAKQFYDDAYRRGFKDGMSQFLRKMHEKQELHDRIMQDMHGVFRGILLHILHETPRETLLLSALKRALTHLDESASFTCVVPESSKDSLAVAIKKFQEVTNDIHLISLDVDPHLAEGSCLIYLDGEVKDFSIDIMVDQVIAALEKTIEDLKANYSLYARN